jgi:hypothetical protein
LHGWLWGRKAKQQPLQALRPLETLIGELIRRPLITGRAEDGRMPGFGDAPGRPDQEPLGPTQ